ncbi:MAG: hypothetical protein FJW34_22440 [Acidobacteria bacterium]|nr:hypothetical protein [Acidobacteriota bacterium]
MGCVEAVLRGVSYLFHLALGLVLAGLAVVALLGPEATFSLGILPWQGEKLAWILLAAGAVAAVSVYLAIRRVLRILLLLWSLTVLVALAYGCFLSRFHFGREDPAMALLLTGGAAVATLGSWRVFRHRARPALPVVSDRFGNG